MFSIDPKILALATLAAVLLLVVGVSPSSTSVAAPRSRENTLTVQGKRVLPGVHKKQSLAVTTSWSGGTVTEGWCAEFITRLGVVPQKQNVGGCVSWVNAEGTYQSINNPLNTTQVTDNQIGIYNSHGVKIYPDRETGIAAAVQTLTYKNHGYEAIIAAIRANDGDAMVQAVEVSDWGTGGLVTSVWNEIKGSYQ